MKKIRFYSLFTLLGFTAIVAQIILHRRFMVVFGGNELTVGVVFAAWMLWAGLGNIIIGRIADRIKNISLALTLFLLGISILLPLTVVSVSFIKVILGIPPPQITGPHINLIATLVLLLPLCFAIGASMVLSAKILGTGRSEDIGRFYIFDSLGSAAGGIVFSWFAIKYLTSLQTAFFVSAVLVVGVALLLRVGLKRKLAATCLAATLAVLFFISPTIEKKLNQIQWKGYNAVASFDSRFGNIIISENRGEHTLFFDGVPQFSTPLPETYETYAYLPLLMHHDPEEVLLIGGGLSGMINQWRDVNLKKITYVQIDPDIVSAEKTFMAPKEMLSDPRLKINYIDGRNFLRGGKHRYDIIIVLAGDPTTTSANRYYTLEFFKDVKRALRDDGVLFFGVFEPTNYVSDESQKLLGTVFATLEKVFPHIIILPLNNYFFAASAGKGALTDDISLLRERLDKRGLYAPTLSSQVLYGIFPERVHSTRKAIIEGAGEVQILNQDRWPIAYYAGLVLWAERSGEGAASFLKTMTKIRWWYGAIIVGVALIFGFIFARKDPSGFTAVWTLLSVGFASIVYEIVLLVWYQVKVGLLFYHIGIIITAFMVGLSVGAYIAIRLLNVIKMRSSITPLMVLAFAAYTPLLFIISKISFTLANFLCGLVSGIIYQLVADMLVAKKKRIGLSAGLINFSDYAGAAVGSLLASIIMIPLFGLMGSLLAGAVLLATAALTNLLILRKS